MELTFSLAIPHAPWVKGRKESLERLMACLKMHPRQETLASNKPYRIFDEKAPCHVWSGQMWEWGAVQDTTHFLTVQDDAVVSADFWNDLRDIVSRHPDEVIGLHVAHPHAALLFEEGRGWCTTADAIVGVSYCMPTALLKEFLVWRANLTECAVEAIPEDTLIGVWCLTTGRKVYHPLPTIVNHDTSMVSAYGNDDHTNRKSVAFAHEPGYEGGFLRWNDDAPVPHLGRMWDGTVGLAEKWVPSITPEDLLRMRRDDGRSEKRRLAHYRRGKQAVAEVPRLLVCTPTRGSVHPEYANSIWRMLRDESYHAECAWQLQDIQCWGADVVRIRSKMVQWFLQRTDATHLLFVDGDVSFPPECLRGMLAAGKDFVAAPYPRRDHIDFRRVRDVQHVPPEAAAYRYSCRMLPDAKIEPNGCLEVEGVPLGMTLLSRGMLQAMSDACPEGECYGDTFPDGEPVSIPALFQLALGGDALLSEDYSFCQRYRGMGGRVCLYLGLGSPVSHAGEHLYHGAVESFGYQRKVSV